MAHKLVQWRDAIATDIERGISDPPIAAGDLVDSVRLADLPLVLIKLKLAPVASREHELTTSGFCIGTLNHESFYDWVNSSPRIGASQLTRISWWRSERNVLHHQFILATVLYNPNPNSPHSQLEYYDIKIERLGRLAGPRDVAKQAITIAPAGPLAAHMPGNTLILALVPTQDDIVKGNPIKGNILYSLDTLAKDEIGHWDIPAVSLNSFAQYSHIIVKNAPEYHLSSTNCYFYARLMMSVVILRHLLSFECAVLRHEHSSRIRVANPVLPSGKTQVTSYFNRLFKMRHPGHNDEALAKGSVQRSTFPAHALSERSSSLRRSVSHIGGRESTIFEPSYSSEPPIITRGELSVGPSAPAVPIILQGSRPSYHYESAPPPAWLQRSVTPYIGSADPGAEITLPSNYSHNIQDTTSYHPSYHYESAPPSAFLQRSVVPYFGSADPDGEITLPSNYSHNIQDTTSYHPSYHYESAPPSAFLQRSVVPYFGSADPGGETTLPSNYSQNIQDSTAHHPHQPKISTNVNQANSPYFPVYGRKPAFQNADGSSVILHNYSDQYQDVIPVDPGPTSDAVKQQQMSSVVSTRTATPPPVPPKDYAPAFYPSVSNKHPLEFVRSNQMRQPLLPLPYIHVTELEDTLPISNAIESLERDSPPLVVPNTGLNLSTLQANPRYVIDRNQIPLVTAIPPHDGTVPPSSAPGRGRPVLRPDERSAHSVFSALSPGVSSLSQDRRWQVSPGPQELSDIDMSSVNYPNNTVSPRGDSVTSNRLETLLTGQEQQEGTLLAAYITLLTNGILASTLTTVVACTVAMLPAIIILLAVYGNSHVAVLIAFAITPCYVAAPLIWRVTRGTDIQLAEDTLQRLRELRSDIFKEISKIPAPQARQISRRVVDNPSPLANAQLTLRREPNSSRGYYP